MTVWTKLSRMVPINKDGACTPASQRQGLACTLALQRQGIEMSANDDGEEESAQDMESRNQMVKEKGAA